MTALDQHIRKGRKFDQVLAGARAVFMADGFEGASVDEIARVAAVSKATLYSYFPDKRLLFMEVANAECQRQSREAMDSIDMDATTGAIAKLNESGKRRIQKWMAADKLSTAYDPK